MKLTGSHPKADLCMSKDWREAKGNRLAESILSNQLDPTLKWILGYVTNWSPLQQQQQQQLSPFLHLLPAGKKIASFDFFPFQVLQGLWRPGHGIRRGGEGDAPAGQPGNSRKKTQISMCEKRSKNFKKSGQAVLHRRGLLLLAVQWRKVWNEQKKIVCIYIFLQFWDPSGTSTNPWKRPYSRFFEKNIILQKNIIFSKIQARFDINKSVMDNCQKAIDDGEWEKKHIICFFVGNIVMSLPII